MKVEEQAKKGQKQVKIKKTGRMKVGAGKKGETK